MRRFQVFIIGLTILCAMIMPSTPALAGWTNVRPTIQEINSSAADPALNLSTYSIYCCDQGNLDLNWSIEELRARLADRSCSYREDQGVEHPNANTRVVLGLWSCMQGYFSNQTWGEPPEEGYYIIADPVTDNIYLTAKTVRGFNYAVTTLDQAMDGTQLPAGIIRDFPLFRFRALSLFTGLGDPEPTLINPSLAQSVRPQALADSVTRMARFAMLNNKANTLVHAGSQERYDESVYSHVLEEAFISRLAAGTSAHEKWKNFDFDWYEGLGWLHHTNTAGSNKDNYYRSVQIVNTCSVVTSAGVVDTTGGFARLHVLPNTLMDTVQFMNWNFERWTNGAIAPSNWEKSDASAWARMYENGNTYLRLNDVPSGGVTLNTKRVVLQDHWGMPSRQMIFSFKARLAPGSGADTAVVVAGVSTVLKSRIPNNDWPPPGEPEDDRLCTGRTYYFEPLPYASLNPGTIISTEWTEVKGLITTYGLKYAQINLNVKSKNSTAVDIDVDDFTLYDSDFYQLYAVEHQNASVSLIRNGVTRNVGSNLQITELTDSSHWTDTTWKILHAVMRVPVANWDTAAPIQSTDKIVVTYRAFARKSGSGGIVETGSDPNKKYPIIDGGYPRYLPRTDNLSSFGGNSAVTNQVSWFDTRFNALGGVKGLYTGENELHAAGWREGADGDTNQSIGATFGDFVHDLYQTAPADTFQKRRPLMMYSDMYSPFCEARRFDRNNNPFSPVNGLWRGQDACTTGTMPGLHDEDSLVLINEDIDYAWDRSQFPWQMSQSWWSRVDSTGNNHWSIVQAGHFTSYSNSKVPFPDTDTTRKYYSQVVQNADHERTIGGFRFFWPAGHWVNSATGYANGEYYHARTKWLQWYWNYGPVMMVRQDFARVYDRTHSTANATVKVFSIPIGVETVRASIDSVTLQYRFGLTGAWSTSLFRVSSTDSSYTVQLDLPAEGGVCEYRFWAKDSYGRRHSYPASGTKWADPNAGERLYTTFERRLTSPIEQATSFYAPGILSQPYTITGGGSVTIRPLPDRDSTIMLIADESVAFHAMKRGPGTTCPLLHIAGLDSSLIHFTYGTGVDAWGGIEDSAGQVTIEHARFHTGSATTRLHHVTGDSTITFHDVLFTGPLMVDRSVSITGDVQSAGITVDSSATLTIRAGSVLSFTDFARVLVKNGAILYAVAPAETLSVTFRSAVDSVQWMGIQFARSAADTSQLQHCLISGAYAGLLTDRRAVMLHQCAVQDCRTGIMAVNGGRIILSDSRVSENTDGITLMNLSRLQSQTSNISNNSRSGILALSRSTVSLSECAVDSNRGDGTVGGLGLFSGSAALLKCSAFEYNYGSGITSYGGAVVMSSVKNASAPNVNWRGNSIYRNRTVPGEGQISLRGRVGFALYNGYNRIADSTGTGKLVTWPDHPTRDWWQDTDWGTTDTATILSRIPSNVLLRRAYSNWSACPAFQLDAAAPDSLVSDFLDPYEKELRGTYGTARDLNQTLLKYSPRSDWAMSASDRLLNIDLESASSFNSERTFFASIADTTSDTSLKRWLKNGIGWCWAETDSFNKANAVYDTLTGSANPLLDQVLAKVQKRMVAVRMLANQPALYNATDVMAQVDSARSILLQVNRWLQPDIWDSVVMYAPCYVDTEIVVHQDAKLYIRPHPGVQNPTVTFARNGVITTVGYAYSQAGGLLSVKGEAGNELILNAMQDTASSIFLAVRGTLEMEHVKVYGHAICADIEKMGYTPVVKIDSCEFSFFDDGIYYWETDSSSYIRNSKLTQMGGVDMQGWGFGASLAAIDGAGLTIENCEINQSAGIGLFNYYGGTDVHMTNTRITGGASYGILGWESGNLTIECSEISGNGDTLPELQIEDGFVDLSAGHNVVADTAGSLVYATSPSMVNLTDGENLFELYGGSGTYLRSGTPSATWNISLNTWNPVNPSDSNFYNMLYPTTPARWVVDTSLASFIGCGEGGSTSNGVSSYIIPGERNAGTSTSQFVAPDDRSENTLKTDGEEAIKGLPLSPKPDNKMSSQKSGSCANLARKQRADLADWRVVRDVVASQDKNTAARSVIAFMESHSGSDIIPAALVHLSSLAGPETPDRLISDVLAEQSTVVQDPRISQLARRLSAVALAKEGKPVEALKHLEQQMDEAPTAQDSVRALIDAMGVYFFNRHNKDVQPRHAGIRSETLPQMVHKVTALIHSLQDTQEAKGGHSAPVPSAYKLYQNFPNPFNPNTEICFDLPEAVRVELKVFNILGQEVASLMDQVKPAGTYRILWDSKSLAGAPVASGMYVYQIKAGKFTDAKKMLLIR